MIPSDLLTGAAAVAAFLSGWVAFGVVRQAWRNHRTLVALEKKQGHLGLRRRLYRLVVKDQAVADAIMPAELAGGWVWIRVTGRPPAHRGERPEDAHTEQVEWALTKRGAERKQALAVRPEAGELSDVLLPLLLLIVVAAVASAVGGNMSAGDVLDWLLTKAGDLLSALFS